MRGHGRSLRSKLVLSLGAMFLLMLVVDEFVRQRVIAPVFAELETNSAVKDARRIMAALDVEHQHLQELDEKLVAHIDPETHTLKKASNDVVRSPSISWLATIGENGEWKWLYQRHVFSDEDCRSLAEYLSQMIQSGEQSSPRGLIRLPSRSLWMFAGTLIDEHEDSPTYLIAGEAIDNALIRKIGQQTQVDFSIQHSISTVQPGNYEVWAADRSTMVVETPLCDHQANVIGNVFVQVPRSITVRSIASTAVARNSFIIGSVAALVMLLMMLQRIVVGPLVSIREHTDRITEHGLESSQLNLNVNDEIGELAQAFQRMTVRLSETRRQLADASHAAGRSQVADTVIHNIGNVLTNVNSLIESADMRVKSLRVDPLQKLATRLEGSGDDERMRARLPEYLQGLAAELGANQSELSELLETLSDNVSHIHDVVRDQRRHASNKKEKAVIKVADLLDDAISCCQAQLDQDGVQISVIADPDVCVESDRSLLLQVVINIIGNAGHAVEGSERRDVRVVQSETEKTVQISVEDSGCGMTAETLDRIFEAHYTTRKTGTGLGLHFCANTMNRLGGQIRAASAGTGHGSTFVLEIPKTKEQLDKNQLDDTDLVRVGTE